MNLPYSIGDKLTATEFSNIAKNGGLYAVDSGANDTYVITTASPALTALADGVKISFKANTANTGACTLNVNGIGAKAIVKNYNTPLNTGDILAGQIITVIYDSTNTQFQLQSNVSTTVKFGGNGSDGALTITSGTTTINLASASYVEKNYTSISITGTGKLAFSNPASTGTIIRLRSQGDVILTSSQAPMIDCSGLGTAGGTGGAGGTGIGASRNGTDSTELTDNYDGLTHKGTKGQSGTSFGAGGVALGGYFPLFLAKSGVLLYKRTFLIEPGTGGAGGASGATVGANATAGNGGDGGRGGGALMIECAGGWNFTTAGGISVAGTAGTAGTTGTNTATIDTGGSGGAGGAGGSAGMLFALYNSLIANSGTITVTGGNGGNGGGSSTNAGVSGGVTVNGGAGGGGGAGVNAGGAGGKGGTTQSSTSADAGTNGSGTGGGSGGNRGTTTVLSGFSYIGGGGGGGGGGAGSSYITQNTEFI